MPLQLQSNDAAQGFPACAFHSQSAQNFKHDNRTSYNQIAIFLRRKLQQKHMCLNTTLQDFTSMLYRALKTYILVVLISVIKKGAYNFGPFCANSTDLGSELKTVGLCIN